MIQRILLILVIVSFSFFSFSQEGVYETHRIEAEIKIDGDLDESVWSQYLQKSEFITSYPKVGLSSSQDMKFAMLYDDQNIYIGAVLYDRSPDSVLYTLSQRDNFGNGDWFGVLIDPYQNGMNAFGFYSTAAGVQIDELKSNNSSDFDWNAVWRNKTKKTDEGWQVEFKIPFSAIRFPKTDIQNWNINFIREVRRIRERSSWYPVNPSNFGELTQMGSLKGLKNVKVPIRLSFTPYLAGSATHYNDKDATTKDWSFGYGGGVDVKYGLNESFTLDMTLVPDFSQVRSDNQVLNLSAFEVKFNENRPFFTEGTQLFSIGDLFYSRRLGDRPFNYHKTRENVVDSLGEYISENPTKSKLINATKLSGRTKKGLGIGFFNGIENRSYGVIWDSTGTKSRRVKTNPLTNYNVLVFSQNLVNSSSISFVNTNTWREGDARKANVSLLNMVFNSAKKRYSAGSTFALSNIIQNGKSELGHSLDVSISKISGNWRFWLGYSEKSDTYNPNDLGFLSRNNSRQVNLRVEYKKFKPWRNLLRFSGEYRLNYLQLYNPSVFNDLWMQARTIVTFKNFLTASARVSIAPLGEANYFEPRVWGKFHKTPLKFVVGGFISSDYSKRFAIDSDIELAFLGEDQRVAIEFNVEPRIRISDKIFLVYQFEMGYNPKQRGVVFNDANEVMYENSQIIYSKRDRKTIENQLVLDFLFTRNMGINFRMRHYWSTVKIDSYHTLQNNGLLGHSSYMGVDANGVRLHDQNYNAFTIDLVYRWIFAPGSELSFTWKQSIYNTDSEFENNYINNTGNMFKQPMTNSLSMKILYYLDVLYFKKKKKKSEI